MKISKREIYLILILLLLVVFYCGYTFLIKPLSAENDSLSSEVSDLQSQELEANMRLRNLTAYQSRLAEANQKLAEFSSSFFSPMSVSEADVFTQSALEKNSLTVASVKLAYSDDVGIGAPGYVIEVSFSGGYAGFCSFCDGLDSPNSYTAISAASYDVEDASGTVTFCIIEKPVS